MYYGPAPLAPTPLAGVGAAEDLPTQEAAVLRGHAGAVLAVRFTRDGAYCLTCGQDRSLRLWNPHKGLAIKTYGGHGHEVRDVSVDRDNSKLVSCGGDRQIFLWDVASGRTIRKLRGHDAAVNAVRHAAEGGVVVSGGYDRAVKLWDMRSQAIDPIQSLTRFRDSVTSLAILGTTILAGSVDGTLRAFDVRTGQVVVDSLGPPVTSIEPSHDGLCVLAACLGAPLRLLDRASGEQLASYSGHTSAQSKLEACLTPSDAHVVAGSEDGRVCFWDLVEATMVASIQAHAGPACSLAHHPSAPLLVTGGADGLARVWAPPGLWQG